VRGRFGGWVVLVALTCVLRATTKKVVNFFGEKVHPRENPGYAYKFAHPWKNNPAGTYAHTHTFVAGSRVWNILTAS